MAAIKIDGRKLMKNLTIMVDMSHVEREAFGIGKWRLTFARLCIRCAVAVLRCNVEIKG